jgi:hypothetical protein
MIRKDTSNLNAISVATASLGGFIKETVKPGGQTSTRQDVPVDAGPSVCLDVAQKALLNRKGNMLFNDGNFEGARRVFITTGYSGGLSRIGDYYKKQGRVIDALQMYRIAHNKKKADEITMNLALLIKSMLAETDSLSKGAIYGNR